MLGTRDPQNAQGGSPRWMAKVGVCTFMVPEQRRLGAGQTDVQGPQLPCQQWLLHWHQPLLHLEPTHPQVSAQLEQGPCCS